MPETVTININALLGWFGFITAASAAIAVVWKLTKPLRKPIEDIQKDNEIIKDQLKKDNERLEQLEQIAKENIDAIKLLVETNQVFAEHFRTNNATGKLEAVEKRINEFLRKKAFNDI